jgi:hypothetical protein
MIVSTDIDIDVGNRDEVLKLFKHIDACRQDGNKTYKHPSGVYFHDIPVDPLTKISAIDHKEAEALGYFKIDILNVGIYDNIASIEKLDQYASTEPMWDLLQFEEFTNMLFHVKGHTYIMKKFKPKSVIELAACLAMIRPAKQYLQTASWDKVLSEVWQKPDNDAYYYKKSHSIGYALAVVVHMNMLCEALNQPA